MDVELAHDLPNVIAPAAARIDATLAELSTALPFLLSVTPTNTEEAWDAFQRTGCRDAPALRYRELHGVLEHAQAELAAIEDAPLPDDDVGHLLAEERHLVRVQLDMLAHRGTKRFLDGSLRLYGGVEDTLLEVADTLLSHLRAKTHDADDDAQVSGEAFHERACALLAHYAAMTDDPADRCHLSDDVTGLVVSNGHLYVSRDFSMPADRVDALLAHEVSTHVLTYLNAHDQPLALLRCGLAGYDEMQEGLAVIAEHVVGGLTPERLELLAARVVAVRRLTEGARFHEVFEEVCARTSMSPHGAFLVALRVFRGGGLTKDAVYLRGLLALLDFFRDEEDVSVLYMGKFALRHVPTIRRLRDTGILSPPRLMPDYLYGDAHRARLLALHRGLEVEDLLGGTP